MSRRNTAKNFQILLICFMSTFRSSLPKTLTLTTSSSQPFAPPSLASVRSTTWSTRDWREPLTQHQDLSAKSNRRSLLRRWRPGRPKKLHKLRRSHPSSKSPATIFQVAPMRRQWLSDRRSTPKTQVPLTSVLHWARNPNPRMGPGTSSLTPSLRRSTLLMLATCSSSLPLPIPKASSASSWSTPMSSTIPPSLLSGWRLMPSTSPRSDDVQFGSPPLDAAACTSGTDALFLVSFDRRHSWHLRQRLRYFPPDRCSSFLNFYLYCFCFASSLSKFLPAKFLPFNTLKIFANWMSPQNFCQVAQNFCQTRWLSFINIDQSGNHFDM